MKKCQCVKNHTPEPRELHLHHITPKSWGGQTVPENLIEICPNTHVNTHHLLDEYVRAGGDPGWAVKRHYIPLSRLLARQAWENRPEHPTYTLHL